MTPELSKSCANAGLHGIGGEFATVPAQNLFARRLQSLDHYRGHPKHKFISEAVVRFAERKQLRSVQYESAGVFDCSRLEMPDEWREQP